MPNELHISFQILLITKMYHYQNSLSGPRKFPVDGAFGVRLNIRTSRATPPYSCKSQVILPRRNRIFCGGGDKTYRAPRHSPGGLSGIHPCGLKLRDTLGPLQGPSSVPRQRNAPRLLTPAPCPGNERSQHVHPYTAHYYRRGYG